MLLLMLNCFGRIFLTERRIVQKKLRNYEILFGSNSIAG